MTQRLLQIILGLLLTGAVTQAADHQVLKVLPHLLDKDHRHTRSPSLFDRDTYQGWLRDNPEEQTGIRYDVHWKSPLAGEFVLKLELLGRVEEGRPRRKTFDKSVTIKRRNTRWDGIDFSGDDFKAFGPVVAWRVTLWQGDTQLAKQQSFLWD